MSAKRRFAWRTLFCSYISRSRLGDFRDPYWMDPTWHEATICIQHMEHSFRLNMQCNPAWVWEVKSATCYKEHQSSCLHQIIPHASIFTGNQFFDNSHHHDLSSIDLMDYDVLRSICNLRDGKITSDRHLIFSTYVWNMKFEIGHSRTGLKFRTIYGNIGELIFR